MNYLFPVSKVKLGLQNICFMTQHGIKMISDSSEFSLSCSETIILMPTMTNTQTIDKANCNPVNTSMTERLITTLASFTVSSEAKRLFPFLFLTDLGGAC